MLQIATTPQSRRYTMPEFSVPGFKSVIVRAMAVPTMKLIIAEIDHFLTVLATYTTEAKTRPKKNAHI
jgi:hypothetical protein